MNYENICMGIILAIYCMVVYLIGYLVIKNDKTQYDDDF